MNTWQRTVWFVTLGPLFAVPWLALAGVAAVTVVALPWAKAALQVAFWMIWPTAEVPTSSLDEGSNVRDVDQAASTTGYLVWLAVAGLWLSVLHHVIAALMGLTVVGIVALFPHLELGRVALVLNPATFRMAPRGTRRLGFPSVTQPAVEGAAKARLHFP